MIILSMNIRGVGGTHKILALRRVCELVRPDVLLIQETMVSVDKALEVFSKVLGRWYMCAVDANGFSGGFLSAWNPNLALFDVYKSTAGIMLKGQVSNSVQVINILNCYGPYKHRIPF